MKFKSSVERRFIEVNLGSQRFLSAHQLHLDCINQRIKLWSSLDNGWAFSLSTEQSKSFQIPRVTTVCG